MDYSQLSRISLKHLTTLHLMLSTHSVTKTAEQLFLSPSTVSKTLNQLRDLLKDELFYRDGSRLIPTPFALKAGQSIHPILSSMNGLLHQQAFDPISYTGVFRLSMRESTFEIFAPLIGEIISSRAPHARMMIYGKDQFGIEALVSGQTDFVLLPHDLSQPPTRHQDLIWESIIDDEMVCLMSADHPLAASPLTIEAYLEYSHIGILDKELQQPYFEQILAQQYQPRQTVLSVADFGQAALLCQHSELLFTCSKLWAMKAQQARGLMVKELPFDYGKVAYSLVWNKPMLNDQAMKWFYEQLRDS
ncbi:LysR family transcriptional regulator [Dongshaea marina]|uniref:LysR family transcriptional regulator n=1 Tax=Dongshaea marina TaxID=2047966 RepID=UPI000D3E77AF|nr:LysR family transcriptional regulator [Dongshaea marina]